MKIAPLIYFWFWCCFVAINFQSCTAPSQADTVDLEGAREEILALHHRQREVHFDEDPEAFGRLLSDQFISINRGKITQPTLEENLDRWQNYFDQVEFIRWDDLSPPLIRFSDDGSLAYTVVHKEVVLKYPDENEQMIEETTEFSWLAIYKKYSSGWKIDCVASTNLPSVEQPME